MRQAMLQAWREAVLFEAGTLRHLLRVTAWAKKNHTPTERRMEVLPGAVPTAPPDISVEERAKTEAETLAERRTRVSESSGQLLTAAFTFLGDLLPKPAAPNPQTTEALRRW